MKIVAFNPFCVTDMIAAGLLLAMPFVAVQLCAPFVHDAVFDGAAPTTFDFALPTVVGHTVARTSNHSAVKAGTQLLSSAQVAVASLLAESQVVVPPALLGLLSPVSYSAGVLSVGSLNMTLVVVFVCAALLSRKLWSWWNTLNFPIQVMREPTKARKSRMQKAADFPPPFPNGWFLVEHSHRLKPGDVKEIQAFGQLMVLFRGQDGRAQVLDAICPHLGANLGVAGQVSGNCLRCCFHGWEFDREGKCTKVHGTDTIPANAFIKKWTTLERNGLILVWHDAENRDPTYEFEVDRPVENGEWYIAGETSNIVHAHINEIPENGSDAAHLNVLHAPFLLDQLAPQMHHSWTCTWEVDKKRPHQSDISLTHSIALGNFKIPYLDVDAKISQVGPGIVILRLSTIFGDLITYETIIPTRSTSQIARHVTFASPTVPRLVGKIVMWAFESQFHRDVPIWESKKFLPKPLISKADGPILNYRRWMSQFYTQSSVSFADALAREYMLDW